MIVVLWIIPLVRGPSLIDCGGLEPVACDRVWRQVAADDSVGFLPITGIRIAEVTGTSPVCGTFTIERWIFTTVKINDCL